MLINRGIDKKKKKFIPLEGIATHSGILAWRIPMDRGAWRVTAHRIAESQTALDERLSTAQHSVFMQ